MEDTVEIEYGVRYQNGEEDWDTRRWFGHIENPEMRASFVEQYDLRMKQFGMPKMALTFLTRTKTVSYSDAVVVDDSVQEPVVEDEAPAAPEEGVEPLEESPEDTGEPSKE